jgi:hypothetical protein
VDHERAAVQGSTVDPRMERGRSSLECGRTGIPVLGTLPWQRGEQEERTGILTPGGASGWRGSDGRASTKGGGGGAVRGTAGGASLTLVTGVEARGHSFDEGEIKGRGRRFDSTPTGCGWATDGGVRSGSKPARRAAAARAGGGRRHRDGPNGPKWATLAGLRLGRRWNF